MNTLTTISTDHDLARFDALDTTGLTITEIADLLRQHGAAHLSAIERIELAERLTRRRFIIGAGALGLGVLAGCGAEEQAAAPTATVSTGYPRTVKHAAGETIFAALPTRPVAVVSNFELDALLALGITPVLRGAYVGDGIRPWTAQRGGDTIPLIEISDGNTWNLESLTQVQPDVLFINEKELPFHSVGFLSQVAPTIALPAGNVAMQLSMTAEVFNIDRTRVDTLLAEIQQTYRAFKPARVPQSIVCFQYFGGSNMLLWTEQSTVSGVLQQVGLPLLSAPPVPASQEGKDYVEISLEQLAVLESDLLLALTFSEEAPGMTELEANPIFQNLAVVKAGRYKRLTPDEGLSLLRVSALTPPFAVRALERVLQA